MEWNVEGEGSFEEEQKDNSNLILIIERFMNGLISRANGGFFDEDNYKKDRAILLKSTIKDILPSYVKSCRTVDDFWGFIKYEFTGSGSYEARRTYIKEDFNKILLSLETQDANLIEVDFEKKVNSEYISKQVKLMIDLQKDNPTEAIGKAKELIESCCKAILIRKAIEFDNKEEINDLIKKVVDALDLSPDYIRDSMPLSKTLKQILGNLRAISTGVAELRNPYGSGHGKAPSFKGLQERHAKLAIGSASTLVNFLWDSYELKKSDNN